MIHGLILSSRLATIRTRSMRSMAFETARSTLKSQQQGNCQGSITWFCGKAILRRGILGSLYQQSSTFEGSSSPTTKTIQKNQKQHLTPLIWLRRWLSHLLYPGQQPRNGANLLGPRQLRNVANKLGSPPPTSE